MWWFRTTGCPAVPFDFDTDGDVDGLDRNVFIGCIAGPAVQHPGGPACTASDPDNDTDVDQDDYGSFQRCYSGPRTLGNPQCAD